MNTSALAPGGQLASGIVLPPRPTTLLEVEALLKRDDVSTTAIARAIKSDPGVSAQVFRATRGFARGGKAIDSVDKAVAVLGAQATLSLVQAVTLRAAVGGNGAVLDWFWDRAHRIASYCGAIAAHTQSVARVPPEQAYLLGLFHGCGIPVLGQRFPDYFARLKLLVRDAWPDPAEEEALYGTHHVTVGFWVAKHWSLPAQVADAILLQNELDAASGPVRRLIAVLLLGRQLSDRERVVTDLRWPPVEAAVRDELGIGQENAVEFDEEIIDALKGQ